MPRSSWKSMSASSGDVTEVFADSTRKAATTLLRVARLLVFSLPVSHPDPLPQQTNLSSSSSLLADITPASFLSSASDSLLSSSRSTLPSFSTSPAPILSLPCEILDPILSYLSSGHLSSQLHRRVMIWAEDRTTLEARNVDL
jgi:hypothetical protein